ncbi:5-formyltetrahydrofolate cyclo-ligase [Clostridium sp. P21]|uniref:5-formyltetrahydrofolate cyclo-ligase n=1 Tax=Clostridium muellerianum TaxID=2716538 RepID=A0A7Y0HM96_9CLOT|nr:5-formyltetrahydrofolate cyclo-ligase [Clostridium muellerianum]NMM62759.1 5-formyltetrahydrofolate cyclo-ligase [Clostridium muellerianum]
MENKKSIRKLVKERKNTFSAADRQNSNSIIFNKIINSSDYKNAQTIFIFVSFNNEVDTHRIIKQALQDGKILCVPKIISKEQGMDIVRIKSFKDLKEGAYGILEPEDNKLKVQEKDIELSYLPGLAFDRRGGRIGYGGGFYDRFLVKTRKDSKKIGLAYKFQVFSEVPMEEHDVFIDGIITD